MLIPNKFNGYSADGIRKYNVGGGVGEAALIGAALGGGSAAITGGDPLKGALIGGLTGGAGAGITGGAAAVEPLTSTAASTTAANTATNAALSSSLPVSSSLGTLNPAAASGLASAPASTGLPAGQSFAQASQLANNAAANNALNATMNQALPLSSSLTPTTSTLASSAAPASGAGGITNLAPNAVPAADTVAKTSFQKAMENPGTYIKDNAFKMGASALAGAVGAKPDPYEAPEYNGPLKRFRLSQDYRPSFAYAEGGIAGLAEGGAPRTDYRDMMAGGGIADLGSYSDGGRMLRGPGDGMSDSIPATIGGKRPARLAEGEFVIPADVVSHLGNGSTDAGAKQLYAMMNKVRQARTGRKAQGKEINPGKYMPA